MLHYTFKLKKYQNKFKVHRSRVSTIKIDFRYSCHEIISWTQLFFGAVHVSAFHPGLTKTASESALKVLKLPVFLCPSLRFLPVVSGGFTEATDVPNRLKKVSRK